jgi:tetratricopeptide (TPR) repeat protein
MSLKFFFNAAGANLILAGFALVALAQTLTVTGKVTLKQAKGTEVPVEGAQIDLYRTDIKQAFQTKSNSKGEYNLGDIPLAGTYTIIVSAPGASFTYAGNLRLAQQPANNFMLQPGKGLRPTLEDIEAYEKEVARIREANKKIEETNAIVKRSFDAANAAFSAKNYGEAVRLYNAAIAAQPEQAVLHLNKSVALRMAAVDIYKSALTSKDKATLDLARVLFVASTLSADKAVPLFRAQLAQISGNPAAGAPSAANQSEEMMNYLLGRKESYRLALQTGADFDPFQAVTAFKEYIAAEADSTLRTKAEAELSHALFMAGKSDESLANSRKTLAANPSNLDALYWLGVVLATDESKATQARDVLKEYVAKAPANDSRKAQVEGAIALLEERMKPKSDVKPTPTPAKPEVRKP